MKRFCYLLVVIMFVMMVAGCSGNAENSPVLPPARIGTSVTSATLAQRFTFESAFSAADAVARIQVGDWLSEDLEVEQTYYEATVLQCFKGDMPETITLLQDGCSAATMQGYPLFTSGNEMLVFLNEAVLPEYESPYWIIGSFTTVLDVSYDKEGARYFADRYGILGEFMNDSHNYGLDLAVSRAVHSRAAAEDPIFEEMQYTYRYIFSETDILALMENQ